MSAAALVSHIPEIDTSNIVPLCERPKKVYSDPDELRKKVDAFLLAYDRSEAEMRRKSKDKEVDEDGFELVKPTSMVMTPVAAETDSKKRKSRGEDLTDFYRFQLKERKMAAWSDVKTQESLDKAKLVHMKESNKFQL